MIRGVDCNGGGGYLQLLGGEYLYMEITITHEQQSRNSVQILWK